MCCCTLCWNWLHDVRHSYTEALFCAVPVPNPKLKRKRIVLQGDVPSPIAPPSGYRFHTRRPYAGTRCLSEHPQPKQLRAGHWVACHLR
ncbi:MAG: hypothetical protein FJY40_00595 [Betaproteobacteria bacterium]|nr:hypothetical protein [Betaproteobacteria bacterium]